MFFTNGFVFILCFSSLDDHSNHFTAQFLPFTHSYSAAISSFIFYSMRGNSWFRILPKDTSACRWGRLGIELTMEDDRSPPHPANKPNNPTNKHKDRGDG